MDGLCEIIKKKKGKYKVFLYNAYELKYSLLGSLSGAKKLELFFDFS